MWAATPCVCVCVCMFLTAVCVSVCVCYRLSLCVDSDRTKGSSVRGLTVWGLAVNESIYSSLLHYHSLSREPSLSRCLCLFPTHNRLKLR